MGGCGSVEAVADGWEIWRASRSRGVACSVRATATAAGARVAETARGALVIDLVLGRTEGFLFGRDGPCKVVFFLG